MKRGEVVFLLVVIVILVVALATPSKAPAQECRERVFHDCIDAPLTNDASWHVSDETAKACALLQDSTCGALDENHAR